MFETEPLKESPLLELDNIILTPHLGATTQEAQEKVGVEIAKQVKDALLGIEVRNAVNLPYVDAKVLPYLKPYLQLGEKIGSFLAQIIEGRIQKIEIDYSGEILIYDTSSLTIAVLKGIFEGIGMENVNYVNALLQAKQRGIEIQERKTTHQEDYISMVSLKMTTDKETRKVSSTLIGRHKPRLVKIDDFYIDTTPSGHILVINSIDKPGVIGKVGTILGNNDINIASLQYGRKHEGGEAVLVLNIDSKIPANILNELVKEEEIVQAKTVEL